MEALPQASPHQWEKALPHENVTSSLSLGMGGTDDAAVAPAQTAPPANEVQRASARMDSSATDPNAGPLLGGSYRLIKMIGEGAYGVV